MEQHKKLHELMAQKLHLREDTYSNGTSDNSWRFNKGYTGQWIAPRAFTAPTVRNLICKVLRENNIEHLASQGNSMWEQTIIIGDIKLDIVSQLDDPLTTLVNVIAI